MFQKDARCALSRSEIEHTVMACVKHYALNTIENNRFAVNLEADDRTLLLPAAAVVSSLA